MEDFSYLNTAIDELCWTYAVICNLLKIQFIVLASKLLRRSHKCMEDFPLVSCRSPSDPSVVELFDQLLLCCLNSVANQFLLTHQFCCLKGRLGRQTTSCWLL